MSTAVRVALTLVGATTWLWLAAWAAFQPVRLAIAGCAAYQQESGVFGEPSWSWFTGVRCTYYEDPFSTSSPVVTSVPGTPAWSVVVAFVVVAPPLLVIAYRQGRRSGRRDA